MMKHATMIRLCLAVCFSVFAAGLAQAQGVLARSSQPTAAGTALSPTSDLPCAGTAIFEENFESGLGAWTVIDGDGRTPNPQMNLVAGWQSRQDYRDTSNHLAVTPSWYSPVGKSNDWLISPAITIGSNSCLSWLVYSQDANYLESYEVRVATTSDATALLSGAALVADTAAKFAKSLRSVSLAAYAGQTVHIAFRQISDDRFLLAIDDIKVSNVNPIDIGVYAATFPTADPGDTIRPTLEIANYGSDTVRSFTVSYQVESGSIKSMTLDSVVLAPNKTLSLIHIEKFITDTLEAFYDFCAWTSLPNGVADQGIVNDSLCDRFKAGTPVGLAGAQVRALDMHVFPVPASGQVSVHVALVRAEQATATLYDLQGRVLQRRAVRLDSDTQFELDLTGLDAGTFLLHLQTASGKSATQKVLVQ